MTRTVNIYEAKTHFSRLVEAAEGGEEIIIARNGKPCVRLVPISRQPQKIELGFLRGMVPSEDIGDNLIQPLYTDEELDRFEADLVAEVLQAGNE